jgi:AraC-like DNA-binding protein
MHTVRQYRAALLGVEAVIMTSDRWFPRHSHDQFGIGVISSGGHRSWSNIGWVDAVCGDIIMVNPGEMHDGSSLDGKPRGWKMLFFEPEVVYGVFDTRSQPHNINLQPRVRDHEQCIRFSRLFTALTDPKPESLLIEECLTRTLAHAFRHHGSQRPPCLSALPSVGKVVRFIDSEPQRPLSLKEMARMAGVSRFHFLRGFARATGATPHAYIVQQRVRLARRLLAAGIEIGQASVEAGFADQSHMTRAFVSQLGMTPACYRQTACNSKSGAISFKTDRDHSRKIGS